MVVSKMYPISEIRKEIKENIEDNGCIYDFEELVKAFCECQRLNHEISYSKYCLEQICSKHSLVKYHMDILEALEYANSKDNRERYSETIEEFLDRHNEIKEIRDLEIYIKMCEEDINAELNKSIFKEYSQYILLEKNNKSILVDLNNKNYLTISEGIISDMIKDFIVEMLKYQELFVGKVKETDLPLIMAIKEDFEQESDLSYIIDEKVEKINYAKGALPLAIGLEVQRAHMTDDRIEIKKSEKDCVRNVLPFVLNSDDIKAKWDELDNEQPNLSKEEYLLKYYKLLMLFGNDVEKVYLEASDEEKEYVIDAYYYYSSEVLKNCEECKYHFRTASPLINEEVLKRKVMNKKIK